MTKFPRPAQPAPAPALLSPKIFTLWRELFSRAEPKSRLEQGRCWGTPWVWFNL